MSYTSLLISATTPEGVVIWTPEEGGVETPQGGGVETPKGDIEKDQPKEVCVYFILCLVNMFLLPTILC